MAFYIFLTGLASAAVTNTTISQNTVQAISLVGNPTGYIVNATISNNHVAQSFSFSGSTTTVSSNYYTSILINQNVIRDLILNAGNAIISNNIFLTTLGPVVVNPSANFTNSTYNNNVTFGGSSINAGLGTNNIVISSTVGQFNSNTGGSDDNNYRVATGTAMKTASTSVGEVGMFGGATPYVQYGIPATPSVIKLLNTGIGNSTTPITATVSAKSNN